MSNPSARLLSLLSLLQARRDWPGALLAERLAVSDRTVRRDVDRLRELGYPIAAIKGPDGGYRLEAGANLPPLLFDDAQAIAVAVALRLATSTGAGIDEGAVRALTTLRQVMPSRLRGRIDALPVMSVDRRPDQIDPEVLLTVGAAVHAREVLRFRYAGSDVVRRAEPHHLVARAGRWYLVGWDLDRDDWRTFRVDRVAPRTPNGPRFTDRPIPAGGPVDLVNGRFRGSLDDDGSWPCVGEVLLDLPVEAVVPYTDDGIVEPVGDGRCSVVIGSWSWMGLAASFGRFDADLEVVGPPELVAACAELGARFAQAGRDRTDRPRTVLDGTTATGSSPGTAG